MQICRKKWIEFLYGISWQSGSCRWQRGLKGDSNQKYSNQIKEDKKKGRKQDVSLEEHQKYVEAQKANTKLSFR